jgi:uncharacterized protein
MTIRTRAATRGRGGLPRGTRLGGACALLAALCTGFCGTQAQGTPAEPKILRYNTLGATGLRVSDIGFGTGSLTDPALVEYALDVGINYFDTAEDYGRGQTETAIGQVAARRRGEMVICTKLLVDGNTTEEDVFRKMDACLERLQTTYVDVLMIWGGDRAGLENPAVQSAFAKLKEQGKAHFTGVSHHGPNMVADLKPLVEAGRVDVILCSYDPVGEPELPGLLAAAREKGIGLVAMKVLPSARRADLAEFTSGAYPFHLAAMRWALRASGMNTILVTFSMPDQIDEFLTVSGAAAQ